MGISAVVGVISAVAAVDQAATARKNSRQQKAAAEAARIDASAQAQANQQAAMAASAREKAAQVAAQNQQLATEQLDDTPDVTIADGESVTARKRRVQASFDVGSGGAGNDTGSIRV